MQISKDTVAKLKNFATINPNVVYDGCGHIKTISEAKNILAIADVDETLGAISVYDLNEFLSIVSLIDDGNIEYKDGEAVISNTKGHKVKYVYADPNILTKPTKDITMPEADVTIDLTSEEIDTIRKAAGTLGHNTLRFESDGSSELNISVVDSTGASNNNYTFSKTTDNSTKFVFDILINNLKLIPSDYKVELSSKLISKWTSLDVGYYIALEGTSKYGE